MLLGGCWVRVWMIFGVVAGWFAAGVSLRVLFCLIVGRVGCFDRFVVVLVLGLFVMFV